MVYFFDIDNTLCKTVKENYPTAKPYKNRIALVNKLYDSGNKVVLVTARGWVSGINWMPMTEQQLKSWGVKYHDLRPKPYFDMMIDDKVMNSNDFFK